MQSDNIDSKEGNKQTDNQNNDTCFGCGSNDGSQVVKKQETFINKESEYQQHEREEEEEEEQTGSFRALIIIGLTLTIALVTIEIFIDIDSNKGIDYLLLSLATPVQIILGKPFYVRFYNSLRRKRRGDAYLFYSYE